MTHSLTEQKKLLQTEPRVCDRAPPTPPAPLRTEPEHSVQPGCDQGLCSPGHTTATLAEPLVLSPGHSSNLTIASQAGSA